CAPAAQDRAKQEFGLRSRQSALVEQAAYRRAGFDRVHCGTLLLALFGERGKLLGLVLGEQRLRQLRKVAIHDVVDLVEGEPDAVVGDPSLRKIVSADALGTVARADQGFARGGFLGLLLAALLVLDRSEERRVGK